MLQASSLKYKCRRPRQGCFYLSLLVNNLTLSVFFISGFKLKFDPSSQGVPRAREPGLVPAPCPAHTSAQTRALSVIAFLCSLEGASFLEYQSLLHFLSRPLSQVHITWPNPESRELTATRCELTGRVLADHPFRRGGLSAAV